MWLVPGPYQSMRFGEMKRPRDERSASQSDDGDIFKPELSPLYRRVLSRLRLDTIQYMSLFWSNTMAGCATDSPGANVYRRKRPRGLRRRVPSDALSEKATTAPRLHIALLFTRSVTTSSSFAGVGTPVCPNTAPPPPFVRAATAASARPLESRRRTTTPSNQYIAPNPMYLAVSSDMPFLLGFLPINASWMSRVLRAVTPNRPCRLSVSNTAGLPTPLDMCQLDCCVKSAVSSAVIIMLTQSLLA